MGPEFHQTKLGQKFFHKDVPDILRVLNRIADALEALAAQGTAASVDIPLGDVVREYRGERLDNEDNKKGEEKK